MTGEYEGSGQMGYQPGSVSPQPPLRVQQAPPPPRSAFRGVLLGCLIAVVGGVTMVVLLVVGLGLVVTAFSGAAYSEGTHAGAKVQEMTVSGSPRDPKVAIVPVRGLLASGAFPLTGGDPARLLEAMLEKARLDMSVQGIILAVDSGGGAITTCDIMHKALRDHREETGLPIVALLGDVAASGGYYTVCGADYIMAHPTTITGSIGVLMPLLDASLLLKKVGVTDRTVKSGEFKTMGSMFAERTPEEWEREREILDGIVMEMYERFVQVVAEGRGLDPEEVRALADGRIYTSKQAKENNLIDAIGYEEDAVEKVKELAGLASAHVVRYSRVPSLRELVFARTATRDLTLRLDGGLPPQLLHRPMYLWSPVAPVAVE
ncbi:MAG: signal peptide peptidase SppA [Candidatus Brocadiae bacterium]|nr:signal peptide peptidase SppA [Candidatus Brocadiia bacterium]